MSEEFSESDLSNLSQYIANLEDYRLGKVIGQGGFGEVYLAVNLITGKQAAIKNLVFYQLTGKNLKYFSSLSQSFYITIYWIFKLGSFHYYYRIHTKWITI